MTYTSVASVKTMLGITGTNQDAILAMMVADADLYLNNMLDIDGFDQDTTITEEIKIANTAQTNAYAKIYLKNFNVTAITKINGQAYTGVLGTDYLIEHSRVLLIRNAHEYLTNLNFNYFTIEYTAGYDRDNNGVDELPSNIELMARLFVVGLYSEKYPFGYSEQDNGIQGNSNISSYRLGDEGITFGTGNGVSFRNDDEKSLFNKLFSKYKKGNVIG